MFSPLLFDAGGHLVFAVFRDTADQFGTGSETTESRQPGCAPRLGLGCRQEYHGHNALLFVRDTWLSPRALHALTVASEPSNTMMACAKSGAQYPHLRDSVVNLEDVSGILSTSTGKEVVLCGLPFGLGQNEI
jgi:hypothetical protein